MMSSHISDAIEAGAAPAGGGQPLPDWLWALLHWLEARLGHSYLDVATLAHEAGLSPSRFSHVFKQAMGLPPKRYLLRRRLERAAELLAQRPDHSVAEVARQCGWRDPDEFTRRFRSAYGSAPAHWRLAPTAKPE